MPSFKEHEPDYYTVKLFEEIEDFDKDEYGNIWYNVLFEGDAETFMWLKKDPPVEGQKYYGHLEKTRSGKRLRFKTDKLDNPSKSAPAKDGKPDAFLKDMSNTPILMYNGSLHYAKELGLNLITDKSDRRVYLEYIKDITDEMFQWIDNIRSGSLVVAPTAQSAIKEATKPSLKERWDNISEPPPSDEDAPSEY